jgi:hypothetical protein
MMPSVPTFRKKIMYNAIIEVQILLTFALTSIALISVIVNKEGN